MATEHEMEIEAVTSNLLEVLGFVDSYLEKIDCPMKVQMQIEIAVEEIFTNIANYAYAPKVGRAKIRVEAASSDSAVKITFTDRGVPYDPLAKEDPDITLSAEERDIGGLGIFMVKKSMEDMHYEYKDGQNILTIEKKL